MFSNGAGVASIADSPSGNSRLQFQTKLMLPTGYIVEDNIPTQSRTFIEGVTSANMISAIKERMLGMVAAFAYVPDPSTGWIVCDGAEYQASFHQDLANILEDTYGGTGSVVNSNWAGTFRVPDLRALFIKGTTAGGATPPSTQVLTSTMFNHTHPFIGSTATISTDPTNHTHNYEGFTNSDQVERHGGVDYNPNEWVGDVATRSYSYSTPSHAHRVPESTFIVNQATLTGSEVNENRPVNAAVIYCVFSKLN